ncbi:MAG: AAA family ATPase [Pseudomonadota bacterium]
MLNNRIHLRRLSVHGFKSLDNFHSDLEPTLTIFIGQNGAGKSTILQIFSFIQAFMSGEPLRFFEERAWLVETIKPVFKKSHLIEIVLSFGREDDTQIIWAFQWDIKENLNKGESLKFKNKQKKVEVFANGNGIKVGHNLIEGLRLSGSIFSVLDTNIINNEESRAIAKAVQEWGQGIFSLELMNPAIMRHGARSASLQMGYQGKGLSGFLAALSPTQKDRIVKRLRHIPSLKALHTIQKSAGWINLQIAENFPNSHDIPAEHISDGYLRLITLASLPELDDKISLILIDEIEDGLEPHILPDLIENIHQEQLAQLIMTSHSPVLVNRFQAEQIHFVARNTNGAAISVGFDEINEIQKDFEYQGAGEIWFHTSSNTLEQWVRDAVYRRSKRG